LPVQALFAGGNGLKEKVAVDPSLHDGMYLYFNGLSDRGHSIPHSTGVSEIFDLL